MWLIISLLRIMNDYFFFFFWWHDLRIHLRLILFLLLGFLSNFFLVLPYTLTISIIAHHNRLFLLLDFFILLPCSLTHEYLFHCLLLFKAFNSSLKMPILFPQCENVINYHRFSFLQISLITASFYRAFKIKRWQVLLVLNLISLLLGH